MAAVLRSGRYSHEELASLAVNADPGFDAAMFADSLRAIRRLPDRAFAAHGLNPEQIAGIRRLILDWAARVDR